VASENGDGDTDGRGEGHGPRECMACRGTGRVVSNLGGETRHVPCPWCEGKGVRIPGHDAQQHAPVGKR
jgi:DnaJ-class molecular chaperone